jgi:hypothetical protein
MGAIAAIEMAICPSSMESMVFSRVEVETKKEKTKTRMLTSPFSTLLQKIIVCRARKISTDFNTGVPP